MKFVKSILWILLIVLIILICLFAIIGIISYAVITLNRKALLFTFINELKCPGEKIMCSPPEPTNTLSWSPIIKSMYQYDIAHITLELVSRVAYNRGLVSIPEIGEIINPFIFNKLDTKDVFGVLWKNNSTLWIAFRGTNVNLAEWINNFTIAQVSLFNNPKALKLPLFMVNNPNIKIHEGFLSIFIEIQNELEG